MATMRPGRISWRAAVALVAVVVVAMVAGAALRGAAEPSNPPQTGRSPAIERTTGSGNDDGDVGHEDDPNHMGVEGGYARDEAGAVAAAVEYATAAQNWLYLSDEQVAESAGAVVVPEVRAELVAELVDQVGLLRDELAESSGTVWFVLAPLATRVDSYSADRAVVQVWQVRVLSADGVAVPQSGWQTLRFELAWEDGDWRIADTAEVEGPTPQLEAGQQPWSAGYLDRELEGFTRVGVLP